MTAPGECGCAQCRTDRDERMPGFDALPIHCWMMIVCEICGNKRCPHADNHRFRCTGSNASRQVGELINKSRGK